MTEPKFGRWIGSLNRCAHGIVRGHLRANAAANAVKRSALHRWLRGAFTARTFWRFLGVYFVLTLVLITVEYGVAHVPAGAIPDWVPVSRFPPDAKSIVLNVSGFMIAAQVGALGVISIALALVTIIAQRDSFSTDVQVYYHESMAFEVVASCLALLVVFCLQLLWPLQYLLHYFVDSRDALLFKLILLGVHTFWLIFNLAALAHFARTTLRFVQQSSRQMMRKQYTASVSAPREMHQRIRQQVYEAGGLILSESMHRPREGESPHYVAFGIGFFDGSGVTEINSRFRRKTALHDVRMAWVLWVARRWAKRWEGLQQAQGAEPPATRWHYPRLTFALELDRPLLGSAHWCVRSGGDPLRPIERFVLRCAFRFGAVKDED
ncbi:hypothetical protein [Lysobacter sp. M15]|uniref:hypothetical protein n=1 Tax=Lysobacter sp. M15 TaxID=2916837 RepID=UPI001F5900F1|nr:hypothetical protein [Lysobacter sp. M15]